MSSDDRLCSACGEVDHAPGCPERPSFASLYRSENLYAGMVHKKLVADDDTEDELSKMYVAAVFLGDPAKDVVRDLITRLRVASKRADDAESRLEEREGDMHLRVRGEYDATIADCWRIKVAELEREVERLTAERNTARADVIETLKSCLESGRENVAGLEEIGSVETAKIRRWAIICVEEALECVQLDDRTVRDMAKIESAALPLVTLLTAEVERLRRAGDQLALDTAYYGGIGIPESDPSCNACDELLDDRGHHRATCSLQAWYALRGGSAVEAVRTYLATRDNGPRVTFDEEDG